MKILYEIKELNLIVAETKEIWQLPFVSNKRNYPVRKINIYFYQGHEYIKVNQKPYRKDSLYSMVTSVSYDYLLPGDDVCPF
jgi:hypothetical protein